MVPRVLIFGIGLESIALLAVLLVVITALVARVGRRTARPLPHGPRVAPHEQHGGGARHGPHRPCGQDMGPTVLGIAIGVILFFAIVGALVYVYGNSWGLGRGAPPAIGVDRLLDHAGRWYRPMLGSRWAAPAAVPPWLAPVIAVVSFGLALRLAASKRRRALGVTLFGMTAAVLGLAGLVLLAAYDPAASSRATSSSPAASMDRLLASPEMQYREGGPHVGDAPQTRRAGHRPALAAAGGEASGPDDSSKDQGPPTNVPDQPRRSGGAGKEATASEGASPDAAAPGASPPAGSPDRAFAAAPASAQGAPSGGEAAAAASRRKPPDWVRAAPKRVGRVYRRTIVSDPFSTDRECQRQLDDRMLLVTSQYIDDLLGLRPPTADEEPGDVERARWRLRRMGITAGYLRQTVCKDQYRELVDTAVNELAGADMGRMRRIYVLMEFDEDARADIKQRWRKAELTGRLTAVGGGTALLIGWIAVVFGYLKLDTITKGYYTRRLQLAAGLVTIVFTGLLVMFLSAAGPGWF